MEKIRENMMEIAINVIVAFAVVSALVRVAA